MQKVPLGYAWEGLYLYMVRAAINTDLVFIRKK